MPDNASLEGWQKRHSRSPPVWFSLAVLRTRPEVHDQISRWSLLRWKMLVVYWHSYALLAQNIMSLSFSELYEHEGWWLERVVGVKDFALYFGVQTVLKLINVQMMKRIWVTNCVCIYCAIWAVVTALNGHVSFHIVKQNSQPWRIVVFQVFQFVWFLPGSLRVFFNTSVVLHLDPTHYYDYHIIIQEWLILSLSFTQGQKMPLIDCRVKSCCFLLFCVCAFWWACESPAH